MSDRDGIRVLVVDDEKDIRAGAERILVREGLEVRTAANGTEGLERFGAEPFDVILLDLKMPGMDGMEVLRSVRAKAADVLVIVITGFATLETAIDAMKAGAYDFIAKPFTPDQLRLTTRRAVEKIRLQREAACLAAERRRTLRDIAAEKSRSRAIIDQMDDGVLVVNRNGEVVLSNPAAAAILGVLRVEAENVPVERLLNSTECRDAVIAVCRGEPPPRLSRPLELCTDAGRTAVLRVQPIPGGENGPEGGGAIVVLSDVTEYKQIDRMKSEMVAKVSHEIRSPLASIHQQLAAVLYEMVHGSPDEQRALVSRVRDRTRGVINLVSDLLDLSRLESGGEARNLARLDPFDAVAAAVEMVRPQADERGISIEIERPGRPVAVYADPRDLESVFVNLITNAVNYGRPGGCVRVSGGGDADRVRVAVSDDGIGIAPEDRERIFEKFYRVRIDATRSVVGTGLGLAIVRAIVGSYGGSIDLASTPGAGSTFTVRLPAALPEE